MQRGRSDTCRIATATLFVAITLCLGAFFLAVLYYGSVPLSASDVTRALTGNGQPDAPSTIIVLQSRLPMAVTALLAGGALALSGLILQTVFDNPLAGPSILGVSSGASLGIALLSMGAVFLDSSITNTLSRTSMLLGALLGAGAVIALLVASSSIIRNGVMLLIVGVMISYLASSLISILNYLAPAQQIKDFAIWGMGSFSGVTMSQLALYSLIITPFCLLSVCCGKPLNALLLGERYAASMGYRVKLTRTFLLTLSGILAAVVTAYCGPIGFIGIIVPHLSRMIFRTSGHTVLLPATFLIGAAVTLLCTLISNALLPETQLPINVVTPVIGVPVILVIILRGRRKESI